jgi:hypothetical protein
VTAPPRYDRGLRCSRAQERDRTNRRRQPDRRSEFHRSRRSGSPVRSAQPCPLALFRHCCSRCCLIRLCRLLRSSAYPLSSTLSRSQIMLVEWRQALGRASWRGAHVSLSTPPVRRFPGSGRARTWPPEAPREPRQAVSRSGRPQKPTPHRTLQRSPVWLIIRRSLDHRRAWGWEDQHARFHSPHPGREGPCGLRSPLPQDERLSA